MPNALPAAADRDGMRVALAEARTAASRNEVPVGAAIVGNNVVLARAHNLAVGRHDPTAHAELLAIRSALEALHADRLENCTLYVTLEPCAMCTGAIVLAKVGRLVFGAYDDKTGMCGSVGDLARHPKLNHRVEVVGGVEAEECGRLLQAFFNAKR